MIAGLTEDQADTHGFTDVWFRDESTLILRDNALYYQESQDTLLPVTVPAQIALPVELPWLDAFASQGGGLVVLICGLALIGFIVYITFKK